MSVSFLHSGGMGDIVCSIPAVKSLTPTGEKANFYFKTGVKDFVPKIWIGKKQTQRLRVEQAKELIPLFKSQPLFDNVALYEGQKIDYNLDRFRMIDFSLDRGDITHWYSYVFRCQPQTWEPWLKVEPSERFKNCILVNRTVRYNNSKINYQFLSHMENVYFVGYPQDYEAFSKTCGGIPFVQAKDSLELASWIASCKLLVANQSFAFCLSNSMDTPRLLEVFPTAPNGVIHGRNGYEAVQQSLFEQHFWAITGLRKETKATATLLYL